MSKIALICSMVASIYGYSWEKEIVLKKDEVYSAKIIIGDVRKDLRFDWTLYKDGVLITHFKYDKFPYQPTFKLEYQMDSFSVPLGRATSLHKDSPKFHIYFKEFTWDSKDGNVSLGRQENNKARFKLYISGEALIMNQKIGKQNLE